MLSLLSTLEEGSEEDEEDDEKFSRQLMSLLMFPAMESMLVAKLGKVTFFQHKQALKLAVMVGDFLSTQGHLLSFKLSINLELVLSFLHEMEEYVLIIHPMAKGGQFRSMNSMVADKENYFQAPSLLSRVGNVEDYLETDKVRSVILLMKVGFQPSFLKLRFKELIYDLKQSAEADEGIFLMKEHHCLLVKIAEEELETSSFACSLLLFLKECFLHSTDDTPVWSCLFVLFVDGGDMSLFGISTVLSGAPGSESMKHSAHAQEANSFARSKGRFKHLLKYYVHPPLFTPARSSFVVKKDDGRECFFSLLLVHVGSPGTSSMKLLGHVHGYYPEVLACKRKGPLDRMDLADFANQGTLHVKQCRADFDLAMKSDFCPFHFLVYVLLMGNTRGFKDPADNNAQVLSWTDIKEKGSLSFPLFSFSAAFKEGSTLHMPPCFKNTSLDEASYGPSLDKEKALPSAACQPILRIGCPVLCPLLSQTVLAWT